MRLHSGNGSRKKRTVRQGMSSLVIREERAMAIILTCSLQEEFAHSLMELLGELTTIMFKSESIKSH